MQILAVASAVGDIFSVVVAVAVFALLYGLIEMVDRV
jgi:hypothetical protein